MADSPVYEKEVPKRWPVLSLCELRIARAGGKIPFIRNRQGRVFYDPPDVDEYIASLKQQCGNARVKHQKPLRSAHKIPDDMARAVAERQRI